MLKRLYLTLLTLIAATTTSLFSQTIERVEPPNWWVGMEHNELQLLVYGDEIADLDVRIPSGFIDFKTLTKVENPNYLFLDITIDENTPPGLYPIQFFKGDTKIFTYDYPVKERDPNSAVRKGFNTTDVIYLITPDRFANGDPDNDSINGMEDRLNRDGNFGRHGGDIQGIRDHLDYIADLGFTAVWLNPVLENDMPRASYHGYAATDFYAVDRRFGTNEEYKELINAAEERGMKVIMDMIMNHSGSQHWFVLDPPMDDWINHQGDFKQTTHMRQTNLDPYASEYDKKAFSDGWFVRSMPDLNQRNEFMSRYLIQNTLWWIEYSGISAIRMDTYPYPDKDFMTDWTCSVMQEYPDFNIVGEEWSLNPVIVSYWQAGKETHDGYKSCLPSVMDFPLQSAVSDGLSEEENWNSGFIKAYEMLANDFLYPDPSNLVIFPDNHDMDRFYTQVNSDFDLYKMGMIYYATMRGVPQFYYGTEILMDNNGHPGDHGVIRTDFPGGWEGDPVNAFTGDGLTDQQKEAQNYLKHLLNWRKNSELVHYGDLMQFAPEQGVYSYVRYNDKDRLLVIFNKRSESVQVPMSKYQEIISGFRSAYDVINNRDIEIGDRLEVPPRTALLFEFKK